MVHQKLVTLSCLVLIFAVIVTNAGGDNGGKPPKGAMAVMALCANSTSAKAALDKNKQCVKDAGAGDAVDAAASVNELGRKCMQKLHELKDASQKMSDDVKTKLEACATDLMKDDNFKQYLNQMKTEMKALKGKKGKAEAA